MDGETSENVPGSPCELPSEMENKPSESRVPMGAADDNDDNENKYEHWSIEQLAAKLNAFVILCRENKINNSNAFDIDMIECFSIWLKKKKQLCGDSDIGSFQEIADYLETSSKVYSCRVDHVSESTSRLVEEFRALNYKKQMIESEDNPAIKVFKPKRQKLMLTTADKLRRDPNELKNNRLLFQKLSDLNYKEIFSYGQPSRYFNAMFNNTTLKEEMKERTKNETGCNDFKNEMKLFNSLVDVPKMLSSQICPHFHGFVPEEDKKDIDSENVMELEGIECRFDPEVYKFQSPVDSNNDVKTANDPESGFSGLLNCVDGVNRGYSYFNPKLLANWKGPKAWKAQAMVQALKSCNPSEKKQIMMSSPQIFDDIDEEPQVKDNKKRIKTINNSFKVNWKTLEDINDSMNKKDFGKNVLSEKVFKKWHAIDNIDVSKSIVVDVKYNSELLKCSEIHPDWWTEFQENNVEARTSETILSNQNIGECDASKTALKTSFNIRNCTLESTLIEKFMNFTSNLQSDDDDNFVNEFKTESNLSIGDLKQEMMKIINQECVTESDSDSGWSTPISFLDIFQKMTAVEPGLTVSILFVALLHLSNEQNLKLFKNTNSNEDNDDAVCVAKPIMKT